MPIHFVAYCYVILCFGVSLFLITPTYRAVYKKSNELLPPIKLLAIAWIFITTLIFLSPSVWLVYGGVLILTCFMGRNLECRVIWFVYLLLVSPKFTSILGGVFGINVFAKISYPGILALILFIPILPRIQHIQGSPRFLSLVSDKAIMAYAFLMLINSFRDFGSVTLIFKELMTNLLEIIIPYYVISRVIRTPDMCRNVFLAMLVAGLPLAFISLIEITKTWRLYGGLDTSLGSLPTISNMVFREGQIRSAAIFRHPIINGYMFLFIIAGWLYVKRSLDATPKYSIFILITLSAGLFSTISRGPWLGVLLFLIIASILFEQKRMHNIRIITVLGLVSVLAIFVIGQGQRFINLLPFIGNINTSDYRQKLFENSLVAIGRNPVFGVSQHEFLSTDEMQSMLQGEGIIDVVNTYIGILLHHGGLGLLLYLSVTLLPFISMYRRMKRSWRVAPKPYVLQSQIIIAVAMGHFLIIGTVSSIGLLPNVTWLLAALMVSSMVMTEKKLRDTSLRVSMA